MQSQVLRYIRFFIFGCWGILLLLMLLYGPWMIQAKQITIPDISITNFMICDTSSFFPMHQEAPNSSLEKARLSCPQRRPYPTSCRICGLSFFFCFSSLCVRRFCGRVFPSPSSYPISRTSEECCPFLSLPRPACAFPDPSLSPTLRSLKERARSERIAAGILRHFLLHAIFRHGWAGIFAGNPGLRPESSLVPSFQ